MTKLGKAFATLALIGVSTGLFAAPVYADGVPSGGTLEITVTAVFGYSPAGTTTSASEDFVATYELENIGSPVVCGGSALNPCSGGDFVLVPGSMSYTITGALGPFTLTSSSPGINIFDFTDPSMDDIEIAFLADDIWEMPGTYSPFASVTLYCQPVSCATNTEEAIFTTDGSIVETLVPEPKTSALLALGMIGLLFCASVMKRCSSLK